MSETGAEQRHETRNSGEAPSPLSWGLCVATLNRVDALETCVRCALSQTRPPSEIVVVDASDDWDAHRDRIAAVVADSGLPLTYLQAERRSITAQRNQGLAAATADILFMIDDDSYLFPDCAEKIMAGYEADADGAIAAIAIGESPTPPPQVAGENVTRQRGPVDSARPQNPSLLQDNALRRWIWREVFLMSPDHSMVYYDTGRAPLPETLPEPLHEMGFRPRMMVGGCKMTVRRDIAQKERFEPALLAYSPAEDADASYRFARHGMNALATHAELYHDYATGGRIRRRRVAELTMANLAFFVRKNSRDLGRHKRAFRVYVARRLLAEVFKDGLSGRLEFPQLRGTVAGWRRGETILAYSGDNLDGTYETMQRDILGL